MLQKPGGGGSKARAAARQTSSSSRQKNKSPDDIVRELQRVPTNKKCADCFAKLPQSVNLSFGTFLCLVCAGIHREFSHRIKGIGHSSFTIEEATNLSNLEVAGNEAVNKIYLANYKEAYESLKQPPPSDSSNDQMKLRYWIRKKYIEQAWIDKELSNASASNASASDASSKKTKKKKKKDTNVVTKVVEPVAEVDLFSDDALFGSTPAPAPAPAAQQTFADFGAISVSTPVPPAPTTAAPPPPETATTSAFNADFGNFSSTPAVAAPPASAPPPPAAIDPFSANFPPTSAPPLPTTSTDPFANPPNSAAPPPPESSSFNADFGNFDSAPTPTQQQEQASFQPESNTGMLSSPPQQNAKSKYDAFDELSMPAPTQPDHPPTQQQPTNDSTNNTQNITTSPKHQYMYSMISNLNVEQLNILKEVIDYRMNQMNSHQQQHMTMNNNVAPPSAPVPKQDQRFASLVDFSASSAVAPPPMSAPPPPTAPPPPPPPTNLLF